MERKTIKTESGEISYLHRAGDIPLVFLHGLGGTGNSWIRLNKNLREEFELFMPDLPGHGRSFKNLENYTVLKQAQYLSEFLSSVGLENTNLAGNSYGGWISLKYATEIFQPLSLILVDSAGTNPTVGQSSNREYDAFVERAMSMSTFNEKHIIEGILENNSREEEKIPLEKLNSITCRTAVIWGMADKLIPVEYGRKIHENIPDSTMYFMGNAGHLPQIEDPEALCKLINSFIP